MNPSEIAERAEQELDVLVRDLCTVGSQRVKSAVRRRIKEWAERAIKESRGQPLVIGESCPTCGCKYLGEMGDGDYSCVCGFGMQEPCEHWKAMLAALPDPPKGDENVESVERLHPDSSDMPAIRTADNAVEKEKVSAKGNKNVGE